MKTYKKVFKNVYIIPCNDADDSYLIQNNMFIAYRL